MIKKLKLNNILLEKVEQTVNSYQMLVPNDRVITAVSGGADSVALLMILLELSRAIKFDLYVVHVNHLLRGAAAQQDADFVAGLAEQNGLPYAIRRVDVKYYAKQMNTSKQDVARILRYQVLEEEAEKWGANKIALGHHADDQAETVLLHLLRGAGLEGLSGILPVREGKYIRPLLEVTREEIEAYCNSNKLEYCTDLSNYQPVYLRNKIRLELMPLLKQDYNPNLVKGLGRLAKLVREENSFLSGEAQKAFEQVIIEQSGEAVKLDTAKLARLPGALQRRILILAWRKVSGASTNLDFDRVEEALWLTGYGQTGQGLQLPQNVRLQKSYNMLIVHKDFGHNAKEKEFSYSLPIPGEVEIVELGAKLRGEVVNNREQQLKPNGGFCVLLDADKVDLPLTVRNRRTGDRFHPLGAPGHKKLKDYFIDAKIPRELRGQVILVCSGQQVVWAVGLRVSETARVTADTARILVLTMEKGLNNFQLSN